MNITHKVTTFFLEKVLDNTRTSEENVGRARREMHTRTEKIEER
jgi:hypothetical protein